MKNRNKVYMLERCSEEGPWKRVSTHSSLEAAKAAVARNPEYDWEFLVTDMPTWRFVNQFGEANFYIVEHDKF